MQNIRRGQGAESDLLIADLLVTSADAIDAVMTGRMREVSCGYMCDVEQAGPGRTASGALPATIWPSWPMGAPAVAWQSRTKTNRPRGCNERFAEKMLAGIGVKTAADMRRLADQMPPDEPEKKAGRAGEKSRTSKATPAKTRCRCRANRPRLATLLRWFPCCRPASMRLSRRCKKLLAVESGRARRTGRQTDWR